MGCKEKHMEEILKIPVSLPALKSAENQVFYDVFTGSGCVYLNVVVNLFFKKIIANDTLTPLMAIHWEMLHGGKKEFFKKTAELSLPTKNSQEEYLKLRTSYNAEPTPEKLLALIWSCNSNMMRFNNKGEFNQTWGKRCYNEQKEKIINNLYQTLNEAVIKDIELTNKDFTEFANVSAENSFVYLDPPYSNTEAGYNSTWGRKQDEILLEMIRGYLKREVNFSLSGVCNEKYNFLYENLKDEKKLSIIWLGNPYKKITKVERINKEYLFHTKPKKEK